MDLGSLWGPRGNLVTPEISAVLINSSRLIAERRGWVQAVPENGEGGSDIMPCPFDWMTVLAPMTPGL